MVHRHTEIWKPTLIQEICCYLSKWASVVCAILERTSDLEPLSETTAPRYLKLVKVPSFCPFTFISPWMPLSLFVISLVFSALVSILYLVQVLSSVTENGIKENWFFNCLLVCFSGLQNGVYKICSWGLNYPSSLRPFTFLCFVNAANQTQIFLKVFVSQRRLRLGIKVKAPVATKLSIAKSSLRFFAGHIGRNAVPRLKKVEFANIVDLNEAAHNEPPHLDLQCLPSTVVENSVSFNWTNFFKNLQKKIWRLLFWRLKG